MKKISDTHFIILFIAIVGISITYLFQSSYAKYRRQVETSVENSIASWNILLNTESIIDKTVLTNSITPTITSNNYVKSGTIAPGSSGSFDIVIDATDVDVDFTYEIEGEVDSTTPLLDLKITQYQIGTGTVENYDPVNKITGEIVKNTASTTIHCFFEWDDSQSNQMDNADDTEYAGTSAYQTTYITVTAHFEQKR